MSSWLASRGSGSFKGELLTYGVISFGTRRFGSKGYVDSGFRCDIFLDIAKLTAAYFRVRDPHTDHALLFGLKSVIRVQSEGKPL